MHVSSCRAALRPAPSRIRRLGRLIPGLLLCAVLAAGGEPARADEARAEIEALLVAVGQSGCAFVRNGEERGSIDAESHLRLKYRKGRRYADTPEHFIERLATKSSWTGRPYRVRCPGKPEQSSAAWFEALLREQREAARVAPGSAQAE